MSNRWILALRILIAVLFIAPIYWTFVIATGARGAAYSLPPVFLPAFHFHALWVVLTQTSWLRYLFNSMLITSLTIASVLVSSALAGYALAEIRMPGKNAVFYLFLGVMMLPGQALLVPQYVVMFHLHLLNSYAGLILPFTANTSGIFLFRQYFMKLPRSYREIARVENVRTWTYIRRVAVPLARPAVATVTLLTFISSWNQFQWPLIMTDTTAIAPIELALTRYMQTYQANWRELASAALLALVPIIIVFLFTQNHIVAAVAGGEQGSKG
ncbi:carbohydrate ABC transporter permease [Ferroacidibacillus organovorans]|uniref:ABC transmembrane type-1 domain-containing protein n=1 Tax=Ferroacidibacillus organovorans TaxID=1765683 RepID=A0A101XTL4_9BACL|nr:carbohydrate ABC transporter permease [Ferroacidibacillus organovorans]KUO97322.1 hypothetical protein ATW55_04560 [Ferroacidibacillus organovorans]